MQVEGASRDAESSQTKAVLLNLEMGQLEAGGSADKEVIFEDNLLEGSQLPDDRLGKHGAPRPWLSLILQCGCSNTM